MLETYLKIYFSTSKKLTVKKQLFGEIAWNIFWASLL